MSAERWVLSAEIRTEDEAPMNVGTWVADTEAEVMDLVTRAERAWPTLHFVIQRASNHESIPALPVRVGARR